MSWFDNTLLGVSKFYDHGTEKTPRRSGINFTGTGITVTDNPGKDCWDVSLGIVGQTAITGSATLASGSSWVTVVTIPVGWLVRCDYMVKISTPPPFEYAEGKILISNYGGSSASVQASSVQFSSSRVRFLPSVGDLLIQAQQVVGVETYATASATYWGV